MSHGMGRGILYGTLGNGGTAYFAAKSDLSTLLEDLALVRPTELNFVPRIWEMLFGEFQREAGPADLSDGCRPSGARGRGHGRAARRTCSADGVVFAMTGSAPISPELKAWVEAFLDMHLTEGYGSTEAGIVLFDGEVQRPAVIDYKLVDVPELGYFHTDRPHPRGELLVKTQNMFPGYYKRPGGHRRGVRRGRLLPDRRHRRRGRPRPARCTSTGATTCSSSSQGEFVAVSKLEAVFGDSPLVRQIYVYGNSARPYLLAVVVPTEEALR